jgi:class 3 adenylate cyclase
MDHPPPSPALPSKSSGPGQRSLAAIVFTDTVNFSARMQADEVATLRLLKRDFDAIREICTQHHGSVLKTTGDGLLLYFSSAVQAVAGALAMQRAFAEKTRTQPPEECLTHRVGIHLGDIFVNDQDVMGDGVNIAARLQAEAEPGGICISQTVYDVVRNKLAMRVTRLGPRELKNISQAVPMYRLLLEAQTLSHPGLEPEEPHPPVAPVRARGSHRGKLLIVGAVLATLAVIVGITVATASRNRSKQAQIQAEAAQDAFNALMIPEPVADPAITPALVSRTLADWRKELRDKRSLALEEYNFTELSKALRDPRAPLAGKPEGQVRIQTLQQIQILQAWPSVLAAITVGVMSNIEPLPPREVVQGALAFARLYNLPELPVALRQCRLQRGK